MQRLLISTFLALVAWSAFLVFRVRVYSGIAAILYALESVAVLVLFVFRNRQLRALLVTRTWPRYVILAGGSFSMCASLMLLSSVLWDIESLRQNGTSLVLVSNVIWAAVAAAITVAYHRHGGRMSGG